MSDSDLRSSLLALTNAMDYLIEMDWDDILLSFKLLKQICLAKLKVHHAMENFSPDNLTTEDLNNYKESLKEINSLLRVLEVLVYDMSVRIPEGVHENHKTELKNVLDSLRKLVSNHAVIIKTKAAELWHLLPVPRAEIEKLHRDKHI